MADNKDTDDYTDEKKQRDIRLSRFQNISKYMDKDIAESAVFENLADFIIDDFDLKKMSPERFAFYKELTNIIEDDPRIPNIIFKLNNNIKLRKKKEKKLLQSLIYNMTEAYKKYNDGKPKAQTNPKAGAVKSVEQAVQDANQAATDTYLARIEIEKLKTAINTYNVVEEVLKEGHETDTNTVAKNASEANTKAESVNNENDATTAATNAAANAKTAAANAKTAAYKFKKIYDTTNEYAAFVDKIHQATEKAKTSVKKAQDSLNIAQRTFISAMNADTGFINYEKWKNMYEFAKKIKDDADQAVQKIDELNKLTQDRGITIYNDIKQNLESAGDDKVSINDIVAKADEAVKLADTASKESDNEKKLKLAKQAAGLAKKVANTAKNIIEAKTIIESYLHSASGHTVFKTKADNLFTNIDDALNQTIKVKENAEQLKKNIDDMGLSNATITSGEDDEQEITKDEAKTEILNNLLKNFNMPEIKNNKIQSENKESTNKLASLIKKTVLNPLGVITALRPKGGGKKSWIDNYNERTKTQATAPSTTPALATTSTKIEDDIKGIDTKTGDNINDEKTKIAKQLYDQLTKEDANYTSRNEDQLRGYLASKHGMTNLRNLKGTILPIEEGDAGKFKQPPNSMQTFIEDYYNAFNNTEPEKINRSLKNALNKLEDAPDNPLEVLKISREDRLVFILVTFFIRYVTVLMVQWCVDINAVKDFYQGFLLYAIIYLIIFWFIVMFINIDNIPKASYMNFTSGLSSLRDLFYYFYMGTNGITRLITHSLLIVILLIIPILLNIRGSNTTEEREASDTSPDTLDTQDKNILNYEDRKKLIKTLSLFTIFIWVLTSIVAIKF